MTQHDPPGAERPGTPQTADAAADGVVAPGEPGTDRTPTGGGLGTQVASSVLWLVAQKWAVRVSGFVTLIVLARLLSPLEFGIVAAAMTVIPMVYLLADLGFSTYLLQAEEVDQESLSTAFWASAAAGVVLSAGLVAVAPLVALAFRSPQLADVLRALVLAIVPTVLGAVPLSLLRRAMEFRQVALQGLVAAVLAQVVAVGSAVAGAGVWALVSQVVVTQWTITVLAWRAAAWRPSLRVSPSQFRRMTAFGLRVSSVDLVAMVRIWAEGWIITVTLGTPAFGLLNIAQRLVQTAQELTAASLVPVSTVVFAKVRTSRERLVSTYVKALGVSYGVVSPIMIAILVTAPLLIPLMFGEEWRASAGPAQVLAVAGIIVLGAMLDHGLFYGLGRPGTWLAYSVVVDSVTVATTALAVRWGLSGVALGFACVAVAATVARWMLVSRMLALPVAVVTRPFRIVLVPTAAAAAVGLLVLDGLSGVEWPIVTVVLSAGTALAANLILIRLLAASVLRDALGILPVPARYANRLRSLLRLDPGSAGGRPVAAAGPEG